MKQQTETAVFGGGCFWCTEAIFNTLKGVILATPGYSGGHVPDPTYEAVSSGATGHAEATKIEFDPNEISFNDLLTVFFATHDPTTVDRQGDDVGTQYRSAIFYTSEDQRVQAEEYMKKIAGSFSDQIVTELKPFEVFYEAEDYHKRYYENHKDAPYCRAVIDPKMEKLQKQFAELLKEHAKQ
ncbi:peptide-methionine (S)-S-oxide reductase [Candidatus Wolfebacteria bacterium RIFOXYD12_FULL_48_21]|uniref:Peptide methionine sulfoxide reductase MsrA n=1 Tax=Candidatus Wolfebacteria bacterium RIFOXYD1_FULL_48_65 TaxID=1802561 RepID=A0A1F8E3R6_9BACT|nr:MAG: peptide-methionine (S)-S-oxide reductase [Candidatus Wolfebacteria bacterium RIFOXYD12_FULL_48_21]OGM95464.1 MAG: peptide-methionine (S)-S-oxide reductase [Candidatus Wolfebacteria bacterium RIFOXYD1_FULL_48_65]OGM97120.1 MAG: peptide-methionine (S)-S-oxide reductase [Candidatus Wolfebacteria bacterium RIFOXYD2_FULL_48_11]